MTTTTATTTTSREFQKAMAMPPRPTVLTPFERMRMTAKLMNAKLGRRNDGYWWRDTDLAFVAASGANHHSLTIHLAMLPEKR